MPWDWEEFTQGERVTWKRKEYKNISEKEQKEREENQESGISNLCVHELAF